MITTLVIKLCKDTGSIEGEMVVTFGRKISQRNKEMSKCFLFLFSMVVISKKCISPSILKKIKLNCIFITT